MNVLYLVFTAGGDRYALVICTSVFVIIIFFFITRLIYFKLQINILFLQVTNFLWADRRHIHSANILILTRQFVQERLYRRVCTLSVTACLHKSWGETHKRRGHQCKQWFPVCTWALQATDTKHDTLTASLHTLVIWPLDWGARFSSLVGWNMRITVLILQKWKTVIMTLEQMVP